MVATEQPPLINSLTWLPEFSLLPLSVTVISIMCAPTAKATVDFAPAARCVLSSFQA
jgi:hypothetical protein